jgi:predicted nucleic acid-binding Zn ribbon protein
MLSGAAARQLGREIALPIAYFLPQHPPRFAAAGLCDDARSSIMRCACYKPISALAKPVPQAVVWALFMATYIYETVPDSPDNEVRRFEIRQSMKDDPLTVDPLTGQRVRRVIAGGVGIVTGARARMLSSHTCRAGQCGCS